MRDTKRSPKTVQRATTPPPPSQSRYWLRIGLLAAVVAVLGGLVGYAAERLHLQASPSKAALATPASARPVVVAGDGTAGPMGMMWIPGGVFSMGSDHRLAHANERPAHEVRVGGFWMDRSHVTNHQFRAFVDATGYLTTAERKPAWESLRVQLPPGTPKPPESALVPGAMVFVGTSEPVPLDDESQWWRFVAGASWRAPYGPGSTIEGKDDHPVVQVSHADAVAYAQWLGKRLPTEAEWEFAARGGLEQATYVWGDSVEIGGRTMANVWDASRRAKFPVVSPTAGGAAGTTRVGTFVANGYGLVDMTGNAWQWTADWYRADAFVLQTQNSGTQAIENPRGPEDSWDPQDRTAPADAPRRTIRGGSFLCNVEFCLSYRPSARRGNDPYNPMSHIGFRLVEDAPPPALLAANTMRSTTH